jgi:hypothetical protein
MAMVSIHQYYVQQATYSMMNVSAMKFLLVPVQVININIQNIVPTRVGRWIRVYCLFVLFRRLIFIVVISSDGRIDNLNVQSDHEPIRLVRPADQNVHYKQQVNVRFLEPPPAPEPAPIIIKVIKRNISCRRTIELRRVIHCHVGTSCTGAASTTAISHSATSTNATDATSTHHSYVFFVRLSDVAIV